MTTSALAGIKVLDLSRVLAAPGCTQILADLGAEVLKIERPVQGDETRQWTPPTFEDGTSAYFATVNRNKKSLTIDMSRPEGQAIIRRLAQEADILVENFKVGGLKKYGLDYESLKAVNPRLIYASLTGFGQYGPDAHKPGYDYIIQALSGLMSITGPADGMPHKVGVAVVDLFTGLQLSIGILAALRAREQSGCGQQVDVSLLDSALAMTANIGQNYLANGKTPQRLGNAHQSIVPYQVFEVANQQHMVLACGNDKQFAAVCQVMSEAWDQDARFATNPLRVQHRKELIPLMQHVFLSKSRDEWIRLFEAAGVPCGAINTIDEALQLPQAVAREMTVSFENSPVRVLGNPIKLSDTPVQYQSPPPRLGQHTEEVLKTFFDSAEIAHWKKDGII
ncbi:CoA-transferase [Oligella sp. HMSC05A10]|uniref:CaiB/BaiF CoA transferase family protein n=1 Tax=Oligella TaxID=90243 RepID=UPI00037B1483|nr:MULTISPECIES: CaiB/BaiF CoA-transferase family protein [Oligella]OFS86643.1 CoA-transferase [Oligella sp. HMSC05A10]SUA55736.1 Formyl-coenzyme A transferase [Oligella urethralis]SUA68922.1 Formyl-coenzyme A transferase [Oligella urethralis]